ncbi:MAG: InlB B-repeat-containing protein, partial [Bacilli bacterium]|nr:InlB B-repeat-containing protein [Bacilli bacterium]
MKRFRILFILLFICSCLLVQGCGKKGEQGEKGTDGREVILQVEDGYIKWQYVGETTWKNLISLTTLTGVAGKDGTSISNITIDKDNNLLIILSNGETKNLGNINGIDGTDGREVTFKVEEGYIKWQYVGDTTWINLIELSSLIGPKGDKGTDGIDGQEGREITFKVEAGYIKWQYVGDTTWTNLIELSSLIGPKGDKGTDGTDGREVTFKVEDGYIKWQYVGDTTWTNLIELSSLIGPKGDKGTDGIDGTDGREITFKVEDGYIKWQYVGDTTWTNLIELSSLIGPKGDKGSDGTDGKDGREITFKVEDGYIKWQYVGDTTWTNLIELSSLIGPKGDNGKSAYEIYKEAHPEYTKSEEEWLDDLVNGRLGTKEETKYTVKFVTNTTDTIADQIVTKGEKVTKPTDPVKEGYIFDGWYIDDEKWVFSGYTITSDITLTARFIKKEVESFSLNNSIKENDIYKVVVSNSINSYNFRLNINITGYSNYYVSGDEYGSTIYFTKQVQLNEGNNYYYILCEKDNGDIDTYKVNIYRNHLYKVEFNTNTTSTIEPKQVEEGTILTDIEVLTKIGYTFKGWDYDFTKPITSNLIVNAIWEANKYTITYNPNGGTINRDTQQATYDSDYTLMEPTYEGHAFMGWYYNDRLFDNTGIWKLTTNITLTANWSAEFNIIYILDGGTNDSNNPTKYYYTTETINLKDPTKVEAIFDGWYTEPKFINKVEQIEKGSTGDITLYAKFIMNKYTLTFETNGGTSIEQVTADYGTKLNITTTRKGYELVGWFKDSSLSLSSYYELGETMPNENLTLYAKWSLNQYKIVYNLDGGENDSTNPYVYTIETETINLKNPTKVEAIFDGWYTEPEFINKVEQIEKGSTGDITLYANFIMNKYTLTFETNGGTSIEQVTADYGTL